MEVRRIRFNTGEDYSILLGNDKLPLPYPNLFLTINFRNNGSSPNNCLNVLERLKFLYEILDFLEVDIEQRCLKKDFLTKAEVQSIVRWSKLKVESFREQAARNKSSVVISLKPKQNRLETARAVIVMDDDDSVSPATAYNRVNVYAKYIGWLETHFNPYSDGATERYMNSVCPSKFGGSKVDSEDFHWDNYKSFTQHQLSRIIDVVRIDSADNPWKREGIRQRNRLMVRILDILGIRRSELARIQISDIKKNSTNGQTYIHIRKDIDRDDHRRNRPQAKTRGRILPLNSRLAEEIYDYIIGPRALIAGAEYSSYLFMTINKEQNSPLSLEAINKAFREIAGVVGFDVYPHRFRHTWNDKYSDMIDEKIRRGEMAEARAESDRQKLMGWSPDSTMAMRYSERYALKRSLQVGLELQDKSIAE